MSAPRLIFEIDEAGPFSGAGPHSIPTHYASDSAARYAIQCNWIIKDASTREIYYVARCVATKSAAATVTLTNFVQAFPVVGSGGAWDGTVTAGVSISSDELIGSLTIPGGYTVEVSYRLDGFTT